MRIAIIGAGLAGLTCAYSIHKENPQAQVEVYEAADRIGGKLYTVPFAFGRVDMGAEAYVAFRQDATEFFHELGLGEDLVSPSGLPSLIYSGGAVHPMPRDTVMGIPADSAGLAGIVDKATAQRIDAEAQAEGIDWTEADQSLGALVRERYGDQVVDRVVSALQGGVYSSLSDDLGVRATLPELAHTFDELRAAGEKITLSGAVERIVAKRKSTQEDRQSRGEYRPQVFSTFRHGYAQLYETLAEQSAAQIHIDAFISGVKKTAGGYQLSGAGTDTAEFDKVIFATPAPTTALLLKSIDPEISAVLKKIKLASSVVVGMKFDSAEGLPDNSGILVAADEPGIRAKAFTFSSKKWPHIAAAVDGGAVVRASFGRYGDDALTRAAEDDLVDYALDDLQKVTGFDGRAAGLAEIYVQRWFGGLPVYDLHHNEIVAQVEKLMAAHSDMALVGAWVNGVGVPAVIAQARQTAAKLMGK
ncbi:protoporphyrinogen oxidase [Corynebacterium sp. sy039]|uniref:protoporphyrinogen oxidase n=1 Tax=Corynebacterium sp. sy039 TaxID=2599641 RepID=UPI0011B5281C|nr:protoporphyrinogen oxidase [Corynebacterium sp. sy039]QDZ43253.1 protoporphyrinogen oxidase [Corynebacterium sp. sy039]